MNEEFLQYLWRYRLFPDELYATTGERLLIQSTGYLNRDAGPDFFDARVQVGPTLWAGNVEVHVRSSDWLAHRHGEDPAYGNVILHVVYLNDSPVRHPDGSELLTLELPVNPVFQRNFERLSGNLDRIPCHKLIREVEPFRIKFLLGQLLVERLEVKSHQIRELLNELRNDREEALFRSLARSMGLKVNEEPFRIFAGMIPFRILRKYRDHPVRIEALLFGTAGFLAGKSLDEYHQALQGEYQILRRMHRLSSMDVHVWKFMRMRPGSFPTVRLAQLAAILHNGESFFSQLVRSNPVSDPSDLFDHPPSAYWDTHYQFGKSSAPQKKIMGQGLRDLILINSVVPFLFVIGREEGNPAHLDSALRILESLKPEENRLIRQWQGLGITPENAAETQALNQLFRHYCVKRRCLACAIGNRLIQTQSDR